MMPAFDTLDGVGDKARIKAAHLKFLSKNTKALVASALSAVIRAGRRGTARQTVVYMIQRHIPPVIYPIHSLTPVARISSAKRPALSEW